MFKFLATPPDSRPMFEVVNEYDSFFQLGLTDQEKGELIEHLLESRSPHTDYVQEPWAAEISNTPGGSS